MTPGEFRDLALSLPETDEESEHHNFQVEGKVFATLFAADGWAVLKMDSKDQVDLTRSHPEIFEACKGPWGRKGATVVFLKDAEEGTVLRGLLSAWHKHASQSLAEKLDP